MAGFLDPKERVIDMVMTETGKQLLMKGELRFVYWIPFDDEVDYDPLVSELDPGHESQTIGERKAELTETPLVLEAKTGYRNLNLVAEDLTNVHRPMFTAVPGVGLTTPLPQAVVDTSSLEVQINQKKLTRTYRQLDPQGKSVAGQIGPITVGFQRTDGSSAPILITYSTGSFTPDSTYEGFLLTMYQSSSLVQKAIGTGTLSDTYVITGEDGQREIFHNRDAKGNIVYGSDLSLTITST